MTTSQPSEFWNEPIIFPSSDGNCSFMGRYPHRVDSRPRGWFSNTRMPYLVVELIDGLWVNRAAQQTLEGARRYLVGPNRWIVYPVDKNFF